MVSLEELEKRHQEWSAKGPLADLSEGLQILSDICERATTVRGYVSNGDPMGELTQLVNQLSEKYNVR